MTDSKSPGIALLVIDVQPPFLKAIADAENLVQRTAFAIEACKLFEIPIALTEQVPEKLGSTTDALTKLLPEQAPIFSKSAFSAFGAEAFEDYLVQEEIQHLLISGIEIPICVYQTALQAKQKGLDVTLLSDCLGGRRPQDFPAVFESLGKAGCHCLPSESVFYSILGGIEHPAFKDFTSLVKKYA